MRAGRAGNVRLFSPISEKEAESTRSSSGFGGNCSSSPERTGHDGLLDLAFRREGARTILARRRFTHPLQALEPVRSADGSLCLMMLNPSGGIVGGDRLRTSVEIGPDAAAILTTASATKVYRATGDAAWQQTLVTLGAGATLEYLPDHLIPHPGAAMHQSLCIEMAPRSRAIVYDAIAAGRVGRGERWVFRELVSEMIIRRGGRPIYINRSRIIPAIQQLNEIGWMEEFNYMATVLVIADTSSEWWPVLAEVDAMLLAMPGIKSGASAIGADGWVVRMLTRSADDLNIAKRKIWAIARKFVFGLEPIDLRKS